MWGRFDQVLGNIHELFTAGEGQRVYLVTEDSFLMLLTAVRERQYTLCRVGLSTGFRIEL